MMMRKVSPLVSNLWRNFGKRYNSTLAVQFSEYGKPKDVLKLVNLEPDLKKLNPDEVLLKHLYSPINPSDINMIGGVYPIKPKGFPTVGGLEGLAVVEQVGESVKGLQAGDWVIPHEEGFVMWVQKSKAKESALLKVRNDVPGPYAATVGINPSTAYRLLRDFISLKPGDVIVQNGANSMVGFAVVQLAREMGVKTINIVRGQRPNVKYMLNILTNLGGTVNVTDEYLHTANFQEIAAELPPVKLALNCVGGESATDLARLLAPGGTLVTYGGMSNNPVDIPLELLTEKQLQLRGFWIAKWIRDHSKEERAEMVNHLLEEIKDQQLGFFMQVHDFDDFSWALEKAQEPYGFRKVVLNLDFPDRLAEHDKLTEDDYWIFDAPTQIS